jgi:hypothetical protein
MEESLNATRARRALVTVALLAASALAAQPALAQGPEQYPTEIVQQFVEGCVNGGGTENTCTCTVDKMASRFSLQNFATMVGRMRATGQVPEEITESINACVAEGNS